MVYQARLADYRPGQGVSVCGGEPVALKLFRLMPMLMLQLPATWSRSFHPTLMNCSLRYGRH